MQKSFKLCGFNSRRHFDTFHALQEKQIPNQITLSCLIFHWYFTTDRYCECSFLAL